MKVDKYTCFQAVVLLLAATTFVSCSLLKVAVSTGDPLSKEDMNARVMTRGFYYDMTAEVSRTADSIVATSTDAATRIAAVRWKIRATRAGVAAAMQSVPEVALADLWILCRRMNEGFASASDAQLFGRQSDLARDVAARLDRQAARLAKQVLRAERYALMVRFVEEYVKKSPGTADLEASNTMLAWIEFLHANGVEHDYAVGSIAEVLADVNDRVSGQTQQLSNTIGWSKDLIEIRLQQDSLRSQVGVKLDSLERNFNRMVIVAEHLPEISDQMLRDLNKQATQLVGAMNASVNGVFVNFDEQRAQLQKYVSTERQALVDQLRKSADEVVGSAIDALPAVIGEVLFYIVLALVVLLGLPFGLGFWLGGLRERVKARKKVN
ncbi:MAG: hypothetical protein RRY33_06270 [Alistipes sp.]